MLKLVYQVLEPGLMFSRLPVKHPSPALSLKSKIRWWIGGRWIGHKKFPLIFSFVKKMTSIFDKNPTAKEEAGVAALFSKPTDQSKAQAKVLVADQVKDASSDAEAKSKRRKRASGSVAISSAAPSDSEGRGKKGSKAKVNETPKEGRTIFVGNVASDTSAKALRTFFKALAGPVEVRGLLLPYHLESGVEWRMLCSGVRHRWLRQEKAVGAWTVQLITN